MQKDFSSSDILGSGEFRAHARIIIWLAIIELFFAMGN
jgi:hypothetical protein